VRSLILLTFIFLPLPIRADKQELPWRMRHAEGWAWYHEFTRPIEPKKVEEPPKDPVIILSQAKEELERSLAAAILEPTKENILAYMALQRKWIIQAATFSQLWKINLLEHPELSSLNPTTQYGVQVKKEVDSRYRTTLINTLAQRTSLLFFYEGRNAFSKAFSKVVEEFSRQHKWEVKAVSIDGVGLNNFSLSIHDPDLAEEMKVDIFPSLFVIEESSLKAVPIAFGMATISQIEENIAIQYGEKS
jgi:conjugal transfer pilus assembly protein TraF